MFNYLAIMPSIALSSPTILSVIRIKAIVIKMISVEPGDTTGKHYSIVLDIGTTTLWGQLIDLNTKKPLAEAL